MEKDNEFYPILQIVYDLCGFIKGEDHLVDGCVRQFVFGISESIATVRAFYNRPDINELDIRTYALYKFLQKNSGTYLQVRLFYAGTKYSWDYTPQGSSSAVTSDGNAPDGILLRAERASQGDDFLQDRTAFREVVGSIVRTLLQPESSHPNVFLNGETCDLG